MRIRKRSIVILSSSIPTREKSDISNLPAHGDEKDIKEKEGEEFLLPLVAAVVDVQAKAEAERSRISTSQPLMGHGISETGIRNHNRKRHAHNWREALQRYEAESETVKEGDKSDYRWDMIMRNPEDKIKRIASKACATEAMPSSVEEEIVGLYRKRKSTESGPFEKSFIRGRAQDLGMGSVEKKRAIPDGDRSVDPRVRSNETEFRNNKPKTYNNDENYHGGSQCKRRNGRGWRCSQRTLVGYSLCEHHLGKFRFKSINSSNGAVTVAVNNKGSKYKELHLIHAASSKVEL